MQTRYPNLKIKIESGFSVGQADNAYFPSFFSGQVFGELHSIEAPDRNEFIRQALRLNSKDEVIEFAVEWVTVIDERGFLVKPS
jgi:hypothetical protein